MHFRASEETSFLILGKSRFPPIIFWAISASQVEPSTYKLHFAGSNIF